MCAILRNPTVLGCLIVLTGSVLAGCAEPSEDGDLSEADAQQRPDVTMQWTPVVGEQLLAEAPPGWKPGTATKTPAMRIAEFFPPDANNQDWQQKLTFESLSGDPLPDPIDFVTGIAKDQSERCEKFEDFNIQSGLENNYPTSVRLLSCGHNKFTDRGQITLIKAIQGNEHFYMITRVKQVETAREGVLPISEEEIAIWAAHMRTITVCDTDREEHACGAVQDSALETPPTEPAPPIGQPSPKPTPT